MPDRGTLECGARTVCAPHSRTEKGAVTAEFAMALPVLFAVVLALVWLLSLGLTQMRIDQAARETARSAARGDADPEALAHRIAPQGSVVSISDDGRTLAVTVSTTVAAPGGIFAFVPKPHLEATSVAAHE